MTNEKTKPKHVTTSRTYELLCGATVNYHRTHSDAASSPEFAEQIAKIEERLLDESVDDSWIH